MVRWKSTMLAAALGLLACTPGAHAAITFAEPAAEYPVATLPWSVALADLNEDTKPDIVVTSLGDGVATDPVSVLINKGDGTFHPAVPYPACVSAHGTAVGDFNGDGNLDVVAACRLGGLATFTGKGDGTLDPVDFESARGAGTFIGAAQLNGAGSHELVYTSLAAAPPGETPRPTLCRNSYNGDWTAANPCSDPGAPSPAFAGGPIVAADFTADGGDEILNGSDSGSGVRSFRPALGSDWTWEDRGTGNTATLEYVATDLQADGDTDVVAAGTDSSNEGRLAVLVSEFAGGGAFGGIGAGQQAASYPSVYPEEAGAGDFDGDGLNDVMVLSSIDDNGDGSGDGLAYHGNSDGTLAASETFKHPFNGSHLTLATGDLNGDGKADAVICGTAGTQPPNLHDVCAVEIATGSAPPANPGPIGERPPGDPGGPQAPQLELTRITSGPSGITPALPTFTFDSPLLGAAATFQCRFDNREFKPCTSPHSGFNLAKGAHTFEVRAIDRDGAPDATPATSSFTIATVRTTERCSFTPDFARYVAAGGTPKPLDECITFQKPCPMGSECTQGGTVTMTSEDVRMVWYARIGIEIASPNRAPNERLRGAATECVPGATEKSYQCPNSTGNFTFVGKDDVVTGRCSAPRGLPFGDKPVPGPDDGRVITCTSTFTVNPAPLLKPRPQGNTTINLFTASGGTLTITGTGTGSARAAAKRRPRSPIRTTRVKAAAPGPLTFELKLTPAAKKTLKRKRALKLRVKLAFAGSDGTRSVKTHAVTLRPPPKPLPRIRRP